MAACSSAAGEQFIFDGTFLSVGKVANQSGAVCAASGGGNITFGKDRRKHNMSAAQYIIPPQSRQD